jgi:type VI secretion system protein ImpK
MMVPTPGGRRAPASRPTEPGQAETLSLAASAMAVPGQGLNPLVRAANPLLDLVVPLRTTTQPPDIEELRQRLARAVQTFESEARAAGVDSESIAAARYALCTVLDETIASTAWGSGVWGSRGLLVAFHNEASGGEKFFLILQRLTQDLRSNLNLIELMYLCLALGMEGRYRLVDRGQEQLTALRERLQQLIAQQRGTFEAELSPNWRGGSVLPQSSLRRVPLWVLATAAGVVLVALQIGYGIVLNNASDPVYASLHQVHAARPVQTPAAPEPAQPPAPIPASSVRVAGFLAPEIAAGKVTVTESADRSVITLIGEGMFGAGKAELTPAFQTLLTRIGEALQPIPGKVLVIGHTDNSKPGLSARYPSNYDLSKARAQSVLQRLAQQAGPADRYSAEGRGDTEPVVNNDTSANRSRNRRVQIIVLTPALPQ